MGFSAIRSNEIIFRRNEMQMGENVSREKLINLIQVHKTIIGDELITQICEAIQEASIREKELHAIMNGSKAVLEQKGFTESARAIFDHCKDLNKALSDSM